MRFAKKKEKKIKEIKKRDKKNLKNRKKSKTNKKLLFFQSLKSVQNLRNMHKNKIQSFCRVCTNTNNLKSINATEMGWFSINEDFAKICVPCRSTALVLYEGAKIFANCFEYFNIKGTSLKYSFY